MVIVKGLIPVRDDLRDDALALIQTLAREARLEEGCVSYEVYVQADSPGSSCYGSSGAIWTPLNAISIPIIWMIFSIVSPT